MMNTTKPFLGLMAIMAIVAVALGLLLSKGSKDLSEKALSEKALSKSFPVAALDKVDAKRCSSDTNKTLADMDSSTLPTPMLSRHALPNQDHPSAHAAAMVYLKDGRLSAIWFAGTREGARDVVLLQSVFDKGQWQASVAIMDVTKAKKGSGHYIKKIGNPAVVLHEGRFYLFFVTVSAGGWAGSRLMVSLSDDGLSWSPPRRLMTNGFANLSTLVHHQPIGMDATHIVIPAYHEMAYKNPEWLVLETTSLQIVDRHRPIARDYLQPALLLKPPKNPPCDINNKNEVAASAAYAPDTKAQWLAWYRASGPHYRHIGFQSWAGERSHPSPQYQPQNMAVATDMINPNAGIAAANLPNGCSLLALNPLPSSRNKLVLRQTCDGVHFGLPHQEWVLEYTPTPASSLSAKTAEFSYPALSIQEDVVDVLYTYQRQYIVHQRLALQTLMSHLDANKKEVQAKQAKDGAL